MAFLPVLFLADYGSACSATHRGYGTDLGIYPRISAFALLLFRNRRPSWRMNWVAVGTPLYSVQLINFFKNVCMAGGLIFIIATRS